MAFKWPLKGLGAEVESVASAAEALKALARRRPFLLAGVLAAALIARADAPLLAYWWRTPGAFGPDSAAQVCRFVAWPVLLAFLFYWVACGLGRSLLTWSGGEGGAIRLGAEFGLGAGTLGTALFVLGSCGLLSRVPLALLCLAALAIACLAPPPPRRWRSGAATPYLTAAAVCLTLAAFHGIVFAVAPPIDADALVYHVTLPKLYLGHAGLVELPWLMYGHWPHLAELLYTLPLAAGLTNGPGLMHLTATAVLLWTVYEHARAELGESVARVGCAVLAVQPVVADYAGSPRADAWWALFHYLAFALAWRWKSTRRRGDLAWAGLFAGFAAAAKLHGALPLTLLSFWTAWEENGRPARRLRAGATVLLAGLAVAGPWYARTWWNTGNPVWPFFTSLWGDRAGGAYVLARIMMFSRWSGLSLVLRSGCLFVLGPMSAVLILLRNERQRGLWPPFLVFQTAMFLPYAVATAWNYEAWRYWLPWLPAMALAVSWGVFRLAAAGRRGRALAAGIALAALWPAFGLSESNALFAALGLHSSSSPGTEARTLFLERSVPPYRAFARVNRWYAEAGRPPINILTVPIDSTFYLDPPYQWGHPLLQGIVPFEDIPDTQALRARLRELAVTHVLIDDDELGGYSPRVRGMLDDLLAREGQVVVSEPPYRLVALTVGPFSDERPGWKDARPGASRRAALSPTKGRR